MMVDEEHEDYIARFYLGQKIEEVLKGDLKRPFTNFNFQSCQNRRPAYSLLHKRMKLSSREEGKANFEKVANRVKQLEVSHANALINFDCGKSNYYVYEPGSF